MNNTKIWTESSDFLMTELYCNNWIRAISKKDKLLNITDEIYKFFAVQPIIYDSDDSRKNRLTV